MVLEWGCNPVHGFFDLEDGESAGAPNMLYVAIAQARALRPRNSLPKGSAPARLQPLRPNQMAWSANGIDRPTPSAVAVCVEIKFRGFLAKG